MTIHLTIQEAFKQGYAASVTFKDRWMIWHNTKKEWVVKVWHTDLEGTRRIKVLVRTSDEAEAVHVLLHGKEESEEQA